MAKKSDITINLPPADDLFSTQKERDEAKREHILNIPLDKIEDFPNHPFRVCEDRKLLEMVDSISEHGVLVPALVCPTENGRYQMISGHRRKFASRLAGLTEIPCLVRNLTYDEAVIIMVDSNIQREDVLPSEKAYAYKMKLDSLKRQGKRTDLTSTPVVQKLSVEILGEKEGESRETVRRYIRLTELIPEILDMVDGKEIAFRPAVEISYLSHEEQKWLYEIMKEECCTPSLSQSQRLKAMSQKEGLEKKIIRIMLSEEKPNQKEKIVLKGDRFKKYFPKGMTEKEKEDIIVRALDMWYRNQNRMKERER